jgi:hypothetical protein
MFESDIRVQDESEDEATITPPSTSKPKRQYTRTNISSSNNRPPPDRETEQSQRFSVSAATEALSTHRNLETSAPIPIPTTIISQNATAAAKGSKVGKHPRHKYAEVYHYTSFPIRLNPHPSGALHIIDVEAFCKSANITPDLALSIFTDTVSTSVALLRNRGDADGEWEVD